MIQILSWKEYKLLCCTNNVTIFLIEERFEKHCLVRLHEFKYCSEWHHNGNNFGIYGFKYSSLNCIFSSKPVVNYSNKKIIWEILFYKYALINYKSKLIRISLMQERRTVLGSKKELIQANTVKQLNLLLWTGGLFWSLHMKLWTPEQRKIFIKLETSSHR